MFAAGTSPVSYPRLLRRAKPSRGQSVRKLTTLAVLSAMLVSAVIAQTASAAAGNCSPNGENRYGEACLKGTSFHGVRGTILSEALSVEKISSEHALNDMYIVNPTSKPPHFIEAGILYGEICENEVFETGECFKKYETVSKNRRFFWGDSRTGSDYFAHMGQVASLGTAYTDEIHYVSPETWEISVGPDKGTSTKNPLAATLIRTGTETTSESAVACSEQYNLEWESSESIWHSGWTDSEESAGLQQDEPPFAKWVNTDHWLRDRSSGLECFEEFVPSTPPSPSAATSPAPANLAAGAATEAQPSNSPLGTAQLSEIASEFAAGMGDSAPSSIEYVTGNRGPVVLALSGDAVEDNDDVDAIIMHGRFVDHRAPRPSEVPAPNGTVLTLVINATTGELNDFGIQSEEPDIKALGPVILAN
jgi:hypothetical protein